MEAWRREQQRMDARRRKEGSVISQQWAKERKYILNKELPKSETWWLIRAQQIQGTASNSIRLHKYVVDGEAISLRGQNVQDLEFYPEVTEPWKTLHIGLISLQCIGVLAQVGVWMMIKRLLQQFTGNMTWAKSKDIEEKLKSEFENIGEQNQWE